jgi:hypothetical protein
MCVHYNKKIMKATKNFQIPSTMYSIAWKKKYPSMAWKTYLVIGDIADGSSIAVLPPRRQPGNLQMS